MARYAFSRDVPACLFLREASTEKEVVLERIYAASTL